MTANPETIREAARRYVHLQAALSVEASAALITRVMDIVDLIRAGTWSKDFDLKDEIEQLLQVLDAKKYGRVDAKTMLRTISAAGFGFSTESIHELRRLDRQRLQAAVADTGKAAARAVDFLSTQIHIPQAEALPHYNQFAVLAELFRQLPKPTAAQYDAVTRWFWLARVADGAGGYNRPEKAALRRAGRRDSRVGSA